MPALLMSLPLAPRMAMLTRAVSKKGEFLNKKKKHCRLVSDVSFWSLIWLHFRVNRLPWQHWHHIPDGGNYWVYLSLAHQLWLIWRPWFGQAEGKSYMGCETVS
jgi:hypothetical protein